MVETMSEQTEISLSAENREKVWIVIAAFNEGAAINEVITAVRLQYPNVVVVDDGSADDTGAQAQDAGAIVLTHLCNLGQGAALQTGIDYSVRKGAEAIVTFDADGQHHVGDIAALVQPVLADEVDVMLGSRFLGRAENIRTSKVLTLKLAILFTFLTTGTKFTDVHNGLRCLSPRAAKAIRIRQDKMAHASEILEQIVSNKLRYREAPVTITYTAYSMRKGQPISNSIRIVKELLVARIH